MFISPKGQPGVSSVTLNSEHIYTSWSVTEEYLTDNPNPSAENSVINMMMTGLGHDFEDLALNGDVRSKDKLLCRSDGFRRLARRFRRVSLLRRSINERDMAKALKSLDPQYRARPEKLVFLVGPNAWLDFVINRATPAVDTTLAGMEKPPTFRGVRLEMSVHMQDHHAILTNPDNLVFGIEREWKLRSTAEGRDAIEKDWRYYAAHFRVATAVQNREAAFSIEVLPWFNVFSRTFSATKRVVVAVGNAIERQIKYRINRFFPLPTPTTEDE
jgi:hypothetical protein